MNKTKYMQTDSRWGGLGYPKSPYFIRNCGCGECAIANIIIEMEKYKNYTPATIQPYCKQYADPNGNGTYWSGIPAMMKHYGLSEVKDHATMSPLWTELAKGNRVAIYLMGSRKGGNKGVKWTSSGHFVCSVAYKYENGKHWVFVKDSYSNSNLRNGWISYEDNMRNDVLKVWSGKLPNSNVDPTPTPTPTPKKGTYTGKYPAPKTYLEKGDKGTSVKYLQQYLNWSFGGQQGYTKLAEDGIFGNATDKWVRVFQEAAVGKGQGDGKVGSKTIAKMKEYGGYKASSSSTGTKIGQATKDYDGKAGDSSGKEVLKSDFKYSTSSTNCFNWTYVFRPKDSAKAEKAASMCEKAIANNNIGYNSHGETAYGKDKAMTKLAKAVNYDLSKITTKCGLSCGDLICLCNHYAGLSTCYIGSGLQLANNYKKNSNFECLNYKKGMKLKRGDVLITAHSNGKNNHVAMVL